MTIPIELKLSSYQVGSKANPRNVWCVGVSRQILKNIPEEQHRITVEQTQGKVVIQLSHDGVKLSSGGNGRFSYATQLGNHHLVGLTVPDRMSRATSIQGQFNPLTLQITLMDPLPEILQQSFLDRSAYDQASDPDIHFPAQHFQEDIQRAEQQN